MSQRRGGRTISVYRAPASLAYRCCGISESGTRTPLTRPPRRRADPQPALVALKEQLLSHQAQLEEQALVLQEQHDALAEQVAERTQISDALDARIRKYEQQLRDDKNEQEQLQRQGVQEMEQLEQELQRLRIGVNHGLSESNARIQQLQQEYARATPAWPRTAVGIIALVLPLTGRRAVAG